MAVAKLSLMGLYNWDKTIFDDLFLPDGVDRETLIDTLLMESSELVIIYPVPNTMKWALRVFSQSRKYKWNTAYKTTQFSYNPIENYDRTEDITSELNATNSGNFTNNRYAYDSNAATPTDSGSSGGTTQNKQTTSTRTHGNIGVTTSQQMLQSERNVADFDIYEYIAQDIIHHVCVEVY